MKVCFKLLPAASGSTVWTYELASALETLCCSVEIQTYPRFFQYAPQLLRFVDRPTDADIVHTNLWNGFAFTGQKPVVSTVHFVIHNEEYLKFASLAQKIFYWLVKSFEKRSLKAADRVVAISQFVQEEVERVFSSSIPRINNGIDITAFKKKDSCSRDFPLNPEFENKVVLLFVGNLSKRKGSDLLLPILDSLGRDFALVTASLADKKGLNHSRCQHFFNLRKSQLSSLYSACDIFLFPSRLEGFGLSVVEAMASGMPIVAANASSLPELVVHESGGFLCSPEKIDEYVVAIRRLAQSRELRERCSAFNVHRAEELYSIKVMAKKYLALYEELARRDCQ